MPSVFDVTLSQAKEGIEIKGCCFKHTAATEQYMSEHVGEILEKHGIPVGNQPVALWKYSIPDEPLPKVRMHETFESTCAVCFILTTGFHCSSDVTIDQSHFSNRSCHHHYSFVAFILCLKVEKYCGVFETLGEKRLASHLLPGLDVLLPLFFPSITLEQVSRSHVRSHDGQVTV